MILFEDIYTQFYESLPYEEKSQFKQNYVLNSRIPDYFVLSMIATYFKSKEKPKNSKVISFFYSVLQDLLQQQRNRLFVQIDQLSNNPSISMFIQSLLNTIFHLLDLIVVDHSIPLTTEQYHSYLIREFVYYYFKYLSGNEQKNNSILQIILQKIYMLNMSSILANQLLSFLFHPSLIPNNEFKTLDLSNYSTSLSTLLDHFSLLQYKAYLQSLLTILLKSSSSSHLLYDSSILWMCIPPSISQFVLSKEDEREFPFIHYYTILSEALLSSVFEISKVTDLLLYIQSNPSLYGIHMNPRCNLLLYIYDKIMSIWKLESFSAHYSIEQQIYMTQVLYILTQIMDPETEHYNLTLLSDSINVRFSSQNIQLFHYFIELARWISSILTPTVEYDWPETGEDGEFLRELLKKEQSFVQHQQQSIEPPVVPEPIEEVNEKQEPQVELIKEECI